MWNLGKIKKNIEKKLRKLKKWKIQKIIKKLNIRSGRSGKGKNIEKMKTRK